MKNPAILPLPLCLLTCLAVGCDAEPEPTEAVDPMSVAAEQGMWPLALPALEVKLGEDQLRRLNAAGV